MPESEYAAIREWARAHGYTVNDKGRLPDEVVQAYRNQPQVTHFDISDIGVAHRILTEGVEKPKDGTVVMGVFKADCGHWVSDDGGVKCQVARSAPGYFMGSTVVLCRRCVERL